MKRTMLKYRQITIFVISIVSFLGFIPAHPAMADNLLTQENKLVRLEESWGGEFGSSVSMDGDTMAVGAKSWKRTENCCSWGAVYIYYRDYGGTGNWGEVKKIAPTDISHPGFGYSVAVSGDILVVGYQNINLASSTSAVYIYYRNQGGTDNWGQIKKITIGTDAFSYSLAIEGDTLIVGDQYDNDNGYQSGAVYIFQRDFGGVDNWGQVIKITPADGAANDWFGSAVAISGDTIVVGAQHVSAYVNRPPGKAYIFERDYGGTDNWGEVKKIVPGDGEDYDQFGHSVAISGDTVVIGAERDDDNGIDSGSAYIFERDYGGIDSWGQVTKITPDDGSEGDGFGEKVAIHGDTLIVDARYDWTYIFYRNHGGTDNWGQIKKLGSFGSSVFILQDTLVLGSQANSEKGFSMGMAYMFDRNSGGNDNWGQTKRLFPVDSRYVAGDRFGRSVSCDGDTIAVGAYLDDEDGSSSGAVYVFERNLLGKSNWGQYRKKIISVYTTNPGDYYGWSVAVSSGTIVTGAYGDDDNGSNAGAAYISERSNEGSDWWGYDTVKKLLPSDGAASDNFGYAVAVSQDTAVVGAYLDDDNGTSSGSVYIFQRDFGGVDNWGQVTKITPGDGAASDYFGYSVSISGDTVAVGSYQDDDNGSSSGSVYVFYRNQGGVNNWGQVKKIISADGAASDYFGKAVALGVGAALIVGAPGDDDNGSASGSAYIFERDQGGIDNWGLVKKITASDGAASDSFGHSVSISPNRAVVGAYYDDDNGSNSGAAYLFDRNEGGTGNWGETLKIIASDGMANDYFGGAVSINGGIVVVGAYAKDDFGSDSGAAYIFSTTEEDELVADFGANGLWHYDGNIWSKKTSWDADDDLTGWIGWTYGLAVDFGSNGLWNYDGMAWSKKTSWDAGSGGMAGWANGLAVDFDGSGLWNYDGSTWSKKTSWDPDDDLVGWNAGLAVDFGANGLWNYDGTTWSKKTSWDTGAGGMAGWSGGLAVDFDGNGLWNYDGSTWSKKTSWDAGSGGLCGWSGGLAVDFDGNGLWNYDGTTWSKKTSLDPERISALGSGFAADFGASGLWYYDGATWSKKTSWDAENLADVDLY